MKNPQLRDEHLSALLDNALSDEQLDAYMEDLKRDPIADAETSQRYSLMGEVMRDELSAASFIDISAAVHRAIDDEPLHNESTVPASNSFSLSTLLNSWMKPLAGVAIAASVASVTLVSFNAMQSTDSTMPAAVQVAKVAPIQPVDVEFLRNVQVASTLKVNKNSLERQKILNKYMLQHSGYASRSTMQGMMPYVRAAGAKSQEIVRERN